ncbi:GspH/FimT family pseudopilin [Parendozoicomonas haliclonae]|nr:GspH/FimT family pseudopilin [Parendozoicomonas haliclonae]
MKIIKTSSGFTLVEVMVVVAILSILTTVVAPSFSDFINRNSLASESNRLSSLLRFARSEAIQRQTPVIVCLGEKIPAKDTNTVSVRCLKTAGDDPSEPNFLIAGFHADNDRSAFNSSETLQALPPLSGNLDITLNDIIFSKDGSTRNTQAIELKDGSDKTTTITLNAAGLVIH